MFFKILSWSCRFIIEYLTNNTYQMMITIVSLFLKIISNNIYQTPISMFSIIFKYSTNKIFQMMFLIFSLCIKNFVNNMFQIIFLIYNVVICKHIYVVKNFLKFSVKICSKSSYQSLNGNRIISEQLITKSDIEENKNQVNFKKQILKKFLLCSEANTIVERNNFSNLELIQNECILQNENEINSLQKNLPITTTQVSNEDKPLIQINFDQVCKPIYTDFKKQIDSTKVVELKEYNKIKTINFIEMLYNITKVYKSINCLNFNLNYKLYGSFISLDKKYKKMKSFFKKLIRVIVIEVSNERKLIKAFQPETLNDKDNKPTVYCRKIQFNEVLFQQIITPQVAQEEIVTQLQDEKYSFLQEGNTLNEDKSYGKKNFGKRNLFFLY